MNIHIIHMAPVWPVSDGTQPAILQLYGNISTTVLTTSKG